MLGIINIINIKCQFLAFYGGVRIVSHALLKSNYKNQPVNFNETLGMWGQQFPFHTCNGNGLSLISFIYINLIFSWCILDLTIKASRLNRWNKSFLIITCQVPDILIAYFSNFTLKLKCSLAKSQATLYKRIYRYSSMESTWREITVTRKSPITTSTDMHKHKKKKSWWFAFLLSEDNVKTIRLIVLFV